MGGTEVDIVQIFTFAHYPGKEVGPMMLLFLSCNRACIINHPTTSGRLGLAIRL